MQLGVKVKGYSVSVLVICNNNCNNDGVKTIYLASRHQVCAAQVDSLQTGLFSDLCFK